jgi:hypothetical protein
MGLKVMCAGCSKEERDIAENAVRQALGKRTQNGAWMVSLVKITGQWSVTVDEPTSGIRALTLVAPQGRLRETIAGALERPLDDAAARPGPGAASPTPPARERTPPPSREQGAPPVRERTPPPPRGKPASGRSPCQCEKCRLDFVVIYEAVRDEGEASAPVACPHCWHVNRVLVGESAADSRDYRAEKA